MQASLGLEGMRSKTPRALQRRYDLQYNFMNFNSNAQGTQRVYNFFAQENALHQNDILSQIEAIYSRNKAFFDILSQ